MERIDLISSCRSVITTLKVCGVWYFDSKWYPFYKYVGIVFQIISNVVFALLMDINACQVRVLNELADALIMSACQTAVPFKTYNIIYLGEHLSNLMKELQDDIFQPRTEEEYNCMKISLRNFRWFKILFIGIAYCCIAAASSSSFFLKEYSLPFPIWLPFDWRRSDLFWWAWLYIVFFMCVTCAVNTAYDTLDAYLLFQIQMYYEIIQFRLQRLGQNIKVENSKDYENKVMAELLEIIITHGKVTEISRQTAKFVTLPIFIQTAFSSLIVCVTTYQLSLTNAIENPAIFLKLAYFFVTCTLQIFIPCFYGNLVIYQSDLLTRALYCSKWYELPLKAQKLIFIFMEDLKSPTIIRAGKLYVVGLEAFSSTMRKAYGFFAMLTNVNGKG